LKDSEIKIAYVVGYMLKILKNKRDTTKFINEFAAIRHGDYNKFIDLIKKPIPFMVIYENGIIRGGITSAKNECDFFGLLAAGPSLDKFYETCHLHYGEIIDADFNDEVYRKLSLFEIRIRLHADIHKLTTATDTLETIIDKLSSKIQFSKEEVAAIHEGRKFLNKIKHHTIKDTVWKSNISLFETAYQVLDKKDIRII
jgi:hypothetical protein